MATMLNTALFISSMVIVIITVVLTFVPNLISVTICISMNDVKDLMANYMSAMSGTQSGLSANALPAAMPATVESNRVSTGPTCDYQMSMSLGVWKCRFESSSPVPVTWGGSYMTIGDDIETAVDMAKPALDKQGVGKLFGDNAAAVLADLVRTSYLRFQIELAVALVSGIVAMFMSAVMMRGDKVEKKPLAITCAMLSHVIQAILLGVALAAFAQQLSQVTSMAEIYSMLTVTDAGYGFLLVGFAAVLGSVLLAVTHLLMLVKHMGKPEGRRTDPPYSLLVQNEDTP